MLIFVVYLLKNDGQEINYGYFDSLEKAQQEIVSKAKNYNAEVNKTNQFWSFYTDQTDNADKWTIKRIEVL